MVQKTCLRLRSSFIQELIDQKELDRRVTCVHSYEVLLSYMEVQWSEIEKATRTRTPERLEQGPLSSTDAMHTNEGQCMTRKFIDQALELQDTISLLPDSPHATPTPPHYLSLGTPKNVIKQLEMGRSSTTATDKERSIHGSLRNVSHQALAQTFVEPLAFGEQFKLKCGRSAGRPASGSVLHVTETCQAVTPSKETKEMDSVKTTISSDSRSAFTEYTKALQ